jgi:hypothetical protein
MMFFIYIHLGILKDKSPKRINAISFLKMLLWLMYNIGWVFLVMIILPGLNLLFKMLHKMVANKVFIHYNHWMIMPMMRFKSI